MIFKRSFQLLILIMTLVTGCGQKGTMPYTMRDLESERFPNANELYYNEGQRNQAKIIFSNGLLYDVNNVALNGTGKYVLDYNGDFYIKIGDPNVLHNTFPHSSFTAGRPVACAGWMTLQNGTLVKINNNSGHYRPTTIYLWQALVRLIEVGVDLRRVRISAPF